MKKKLILRISDNCANQRNTQIILLVISLLPFFILAKSISQNSFNLPFWDDYEAILQFLIEWKKLEGFAKIKSLIKHHNEHRLISLRTLVVLYFLVKGSINFKIITLLGNIQLLIIGMILTRFSLKFSRKNYGLNVLIISLCLFDISNYENNIWAMAAVSNFSVIMFFLLSILFYQSEKKIAIIPAVIFQAICTLSNGNGILACISIVLYNLMNFNKEKLFSSIVISIISYFIYFHDFQIGISSADEKNFIGITFFILKMFGSHFCYYSIFRSIVSIFSLTVLFFWLYPVVKKRDIQWFKNNSELISILFFVLITVITLAYFRSTGWNGAGSYTSRYLIYAHIYAIIFFLILSDLIKKKRGSRILLTIITMIYLVSYINNYAYSETGIKKINTLMSDKNLAHPDVTKARLIEYEACKENIFCAETKK